MEIQFRTASVKMLYMHMTRTFKPLFDFHGIPIPPLETDLQGQPPRAFESVEEFLIFLVMFSSIMNKLTQELGAVRDIKTIHHTALNAEAQYGRRFPDLARVVETFMTPLLKDSEETTTFKPVGSRSLSNGSASLLPPLSGMLASGNDGLSRTLSGGKPHKNPFLHK